jgi:hypothetical protein
MKLKKLFFFFVAAIFFAASGLAAEEVKPEGKQEAQKSVTGTVTDMKLDVEGREVWLATSPKLLGVPVEKGDKVEYTGGVPMSNFKSRSLDKTFESILFISQISVLNKERPAVPSDDYHKHIGQEQKPLTPPKSGEIEKAEGGKTIADILSESEQLKDRKVFFKAKIMKVSRQIMKKNWYTLQDGTGTEPENKIIAISKETAAPGDIITVTGVVKTNVDLGAGYRYEVLIDDATFGK